MIMELQKTLYNFTDQFVSGIRIRKTTLLVNTSCHDVHKGEDNRDKLFLL